MKKALLILLSVILFLTAYSQIPEKFNYQGLIRNSSGELVKNTSITVRISLFKGSASGELKYSESHSVTTNNYGQFAVSIGSGTIISGSFLTNDWSQLMFIKTEVANPAGGVYSDMGTVQLLSVPYAFYAKNVENNNDADANPSNELQLISISNDTVYLSNGGYVKLPEDKVNDADANPINELQAISISNDTIFLSNGGFIKLPADQVNDADYDPLNEIQDLNLSSNILTITNKTSPTQINLASYTGTNTDEQHLNLS